MPAAATRWKKQLGSFLRDLRKQAGKSVAEAARELHVKGPTLSQYESGLNRPQWPTVVALLQFYGATEEQAAEAERRWEDAGTKTLRVRLVADASDDFRTFVRSELEASAVRVLSPSIMPGLMQTEQYVRALMIASHRFLLPEADLDDYVKARLNRQKRLTGPNPLTLHALIDEAAIRRVVGGRETMLAQLGHLLALGSLPNITIQVIPFGAGAYGTMSGGCVIVDYPEPGEMPGVYLEYLGGGDWVDNDVDVRRITTTFDDARAIALPPSDSADLVRRQMRALETDDDGHEVA